MRVKAVVVDVDGTLTDRNGRIPAEVVWALGQLSREGIRVVLASGNAYPVMVALAYYLPVTRLVIAENGGVVGYMKSRVVLGRPEVAQRARAAVVEKAGDVVEDSWQNDYRLVDMAFKVRPGVSSDEAARRVAEAVRGLPVVVESSGWALHVRDSSVDKGRGLLEACKMLGIDPGEVAAVGDSDTDIPMFKAAGFSVALGNSTPGLRNAASVVVERGYWQGFLEACMLLLRLS